MPSTVNWYPQQAKQVTEQQAQKMLEVLADAMLREARNILSDGNHLDTHFLWQSGYMSKPSGTTSIAPDGVYNSTKGNGALERFAGQPLTVNKGAAVGFAASYALPVEMRYSFLYGAVMRIVANADSIVSGIK